MSHAGEIESLFRCRDPRCERDMQRGSYLWEVVVAATGKIGKKRGKGKGSATYAIPRHTHHLERSAEVAQVRLGLVAARACNDNWHKNQRKEDDPGKGKHH